MIRIAERAIRRRATRRAIRKVRMGLIMHRLRVVAIVALLELFALAGLFCSILLAPANSTSASGLQGRAIDSVINEEKKEAPSRLLFFALKLINDFT